MGLFGKDYPKLTALKTKAEEQITQADVDAANTELTEAGLEHVQLISKKELTDLQSKMSQLETANAGLQKSVDEKTASLKTAEDELASLKKAAEEKPKARGAAATQVMQNVVENPPGDPDGDDEEANLTSVDQQAREIQKKFSAKK